MSLEPSSSQLEPVRGEPKELFPGRGLPLHTGPLLRAFGHRYLDPIPYDAGDLARVQELARQGVVVYAHRSANWVDMLFLQRQLPRRGLPHPSYVAGFNSRWMYPPWTWLTRHPSPPGLPADPAEQDGWRLEQTLRHGLNALVFLKQPVTLVNPRPRQSLQLGLAIIRAQRASEKPIFVLPELIIWLHYPRSLKPSLQDVVFGTADSPGALRALGVAWLLYRWAKIRVGLPVNVQEFLAKNPGVPDEILARKLRFAVSYHLSREQHVLNGPPLKTHKRMREEALRDPRLSKAAQAISKQRNRPLPAVMAQAHAYYDEVASRFDLDLMSVLDWMTRAVWNRIYDGMEVHPEDVAKLREASRKAALVLLPAHRSHIDYMVLGQVMYWNGMMPPLIAAGINLAFWPLGFFFRRCGAYFIRRSFKGDPLYPAVVKAYIRYILKQGFTQEFFVEGTRSRSGKTLQPKFGLLTMVVEGFLDGGIKDVALVPVGIGYEKIVESKSYVQELAGQDKQKENIRGLLSAAKVLRHKYGRVYVTFDEPIYLRPFLDQRGVKMDGDLESASVRSAIRALGHQVVFGISRCSVVTPTSVAALALLGAPQRGLDHGTLLAQGRRVVEHIPRAEPKARISPALEADLEMALVEAMNRLAEEGHVEMTEERGQVVYRANPQRRIYIDYYKNNILHFFVPDAILAKTVLSFSQAAGTPIPVSELMDRALMLSRLLKFEVTFPVGRGFDVLFGEAVERAVAEGYLQRSAQGLALSPEPLAQQVARFAANILANFLECYLHALRALPDAMARPRARRELVRALMDRVQAAVVAGECKHSESVNKEVLENVVEYAQDQKLVNSPPDGNGALEAVPDLAVRVQTLTADIARFLPGAR